MQVLMQNVYWAFARQNISNYNDFVVAVTAYNNDVAPDESEWEPDSVVAQGVIKVVFEAGWKDEDDELELNIGQPGKPLTMGTLLFELNTATFDFFKDADGCFFEGLAPVGDNVFELLIGS
jgi:hypothetical protein